MINIFNETKTIIDKNIGKIIEGHTLEVLREFPDESIDEIITSPPYFNVRDYKTRPVKFNDGWVGQLGLEPTIELYVAHLCEIFDECNRVLKKTGTLWVNLGDGYASGSTMSMQERIEKEKKSETKLAKTEKRPKPKTNINQKSLLGIPFRFAIEMIDNHNWILRNTIIWHKPNAMPSSSKNRFTNNFEYVFFFVKNNSKPIYYVNKTTKEIRYSKPIKTLEGEGTDWEWVETKNGKKKRTLWDGIYYHFNQIFEPIADATIERSSRDFIAGKNSEGVFRGLTAETQKKWYDKVKSGETVLRNKRTIFEIDYSETDLLEMFIVFLSLFKPANAGEIWEIATENNSEAHYAPFPTKLVEPMILAGCPKEICLKCGIPREAIIKRVKMPEWDKEDKHNKIHNRGKTSILKVVGKISSDWKKDNPDVFDGFSNCGCNVGYTSGIVLDIFAGSGTTLRVAKKLARKGIGIELNPEYIKIAKKLNTIWRKDLTIKPEEYTSLDTLLGLSRERTDNLKE